MLVIHVYLHIRVVIKLANQLAKAQCIKMHIGSELLEMFPSNIKIGVMCDLCDLWQIGCFEYFRNC